MKEISKETLVTSLPLCQIYLQLNKDKYNALMSSISMLEDQNDGEIYLHFGVDKKLPMVLVEKQDDGSVIYTILERYSSEDGSWSGQTFETIEQLATWWLMAY